MRFNFTYRHILLFLSSFLQPLSGKVRVMEHLRVGIVGCGHISQTHLQAWRKQAGAEVVGVFDVNPELSRQRARDYGVRQVYDNLQELIAASDVVDVCTPPQTHSEISHRVITARRHLLIEKPLVTDVLEWQRLSTVARFAHCNLTVVHNLKFTHSVQQAKQWVDDGRIGEVISLHRQFLTCPDTDRMLVGNSHWSHNLPGGRWFETLPHELYLTHYFAGPLALTNVTACRTPHAPAGTPADEVFITLGDEGCLATMHYSANCRLNRRRLTINGTHGAIEIDFLSDTAILSTLGDRKWRRGAGLPLLEAGATLLRGVPDRAGYWWRRMRKETPHAALIRAFTAHLLHGAPPPTPLDEIDYVVRQGDAIGRRIDECAAENAENNNAVPPQMALVRRAGGAF